MSGYRLHIHNWQARSFVRKNGLEGTAFPPVKSRTFKSERAAIAKAALILANLYDPRIPDGLAPVAQIVDPDGGSRAFKVGASLGIVECEPGSWEHAVSAPPTGAATTMVWGVR